MWSQSQMTFSVFVSFVVWIISQNKSAYGKSKSIVKIKHL